MLLPRVTEEKTNDEKLNNLLKQTKVPFVRARIETKVFSDSKSLSIVNS